MSGGIFVGCLLLCLGGVSVSMFKQKQFYCWFVVEDRGLEFNLLWLLFYDLLMFSAGRGMWDRLVESGFALLSV